MCVVEHARPVLSLTTIEEYVRQLIDRVETLEQAVEELQDDVNDLKYRVEELEERSDEED